MYNIQASIENKEDIKEKKYVIEHLTILIQAWLGRLILLTPLILISFSVFDYYISPEIFKKYIYYRILGGAFFIVFYYFNRIKRNYYYQNILIIIGVIVISCIVEAISITFDGHKFFYYFGLQLILIGVLGFVPMGIVMSSTVIIVMSLIFVVPLVLFNKIFDMLAFILFCGYFGATCMLALLWRITNQERIISRLKLQYHLEQTVVTQASEIEKTGIMLETLMDNAAEGILILSTEGKILNANKNAYRIYRVTEKDDFIGANILALEKEEIIPIWKDVFNKTDNSLVIFEIKRQEGNKINYYEVNSGYMEIGNQRFIQAFYRDITERKELQDQLIHAQKMETMGVITGTIAHDFKNVLSTILSFTELIVYENKLGVKVMSQEELYERVLLVQDEIQLASQLIQKLLGFGVKDSEKKFPLNINNKIKELTRMFTVLFPKNIRIENDLDICVPNIIANNNQIENILVNLMINAKEAIEEEGVIAIKTEVVEIDNKESEDNENRNKKFIKLQIKDTGIGISEDDLNNIFEPFYTKKYKMRVPGTGLGLSIVYKIVKEYGGMIDVKSRVGEGTVFDIYFPVEIETVI